MGGSNRSTEPVGDYLSKKIATRVQEDLEQYMEINPELGSGSERPRGVLFVVDRTMDPVAPFLHEFWYQAMVNDLLTIEDGKRYKYKYENTVGAKETRVAILDEHDEVWMSVRNLHMKDAIDTLMTDFAKFAQENAGFRGNAQNVQMNDLKDMLASLPQFQTQRDQFSLHLDMAQECMNIVQKDNLMAAADVEQVRWFAAVADSSAVQRATRQKGRLRKRLWSRWSPCWMTGTLTAGTRSASLPCTSCLGMVWPTRTGGGCTSTRGCPSPNRTRSTISSTWVSRWSKTRRRIGSVARASSKRTHVRRIPTTRPGTSRLWP